jgi:hypothetical protein
MFAKLMNNSFFVEFIFGLSVVLNEDSWTLICLGDLLETSNGYMDDNLALALFDLFIQLINDPIYYFY